MWKKFGLAGVVTFLTVVLAGCSTHTPPIEEGIYSKEEIRAIYSSDNVQKSANYCSSVSLYKMTQAQKGHCTQYWVSNKWGEDVTGSQKMKPTILSRFNYLEDGRVPTKCRLKNYGAAGRCLQRVAKALIELRCPSINDERIARNPDCDGYPQARALEYAKLGEVLIMIDDKNTKETEKLLRN